MFDSDSLAILLRVAGSQPWQRQVSAIPDLLVPVLRSDTALPDELLETVLGSGRGELIQALLIRVDATAAADAQLRHRLASTGIARVAQHALQRRWGLRDQRTIFASARADDNDWVGPEGIVAQVLDLSRVEQLRPVVVSPFPVLVRHALGKVGGQLTPAEQLRGLLTIATEEGPQALHDLLNRQTLAEQVASDTTRILAANRCAAAKAGNTAAKANVVCALAALVAEAESTAGAIRELREGHDPAQLSWRDDLDWELIGSVHEREPFPETAARALVARPDCPERVMLALCATHPAATTDVTHPTAALIAAPVPAGTTASVANTVLRSRSTRAIQVGLPADALLRATPAHAMLEALHRGPAGPRDPEVRAELGRMVADRLCADVTRWRLLRTRLRSHRGSIVELLDEVGRHPAGQPPAAVPWPDAKPLPDLSVTKTVTGVRAAFLTLLDAASPATQLTLPGHLDDQTIHDLFTRGRWQDAWVQAADTSGNPACWRAMACRRDISSAAIDQLAGHDDPQTNGQLFLRRNASPQQRVRVLSGRPHKRGRTEPVPLDPALREHLMSYTGGSGTSPYVSRDAIDCADQELQCHILRFRIVYGEIPQLRLILNLWRRHGRESVAALISATNGPATFKQRFFPATSTRRIQRFLDAKDEAASLALLEAAVVEGETPEWQIAFLRSVPSATSTKLRETHDWHWDSIMEEHRRQPFLQDVLVALCDRPGCPAAFRAAFASQLEAALAAGSPAAAALAHAGELFEPVLLRALGTGRLTWGDVIEHGRPCSQVLRCLGSEEASKLTSPTQSDGVAALADLVGRTLDGRPEAWVLAARMLPDFDGTIPELLHTAVAATS